MINCLRVSPVCVLVWIVGLVGRGSRLSRPEDEDNSPFHDDGNHLHRQHSNVQSGGLKDYEPVEIGAQVVGETSSSQSPNHGGSVHTQLYCPYFFNQQKTM